LNHWPPYASYIALEFFEDQKKNHYVRLIFNGNLEYLPKSINTKDRNSPFEYLLPLDTFKEITKDVIPKSFEEECRIQKIYKN
jgi:hypothetical protein